MFHQVFVAMGETYNDRVKRFAEFFYNSAQKNAQVKPKRNQNSRNKKQWKSRSDHMGPFASRPLHKYTSDSRYD